MTKEMTIVFSRTMKQTPVVHVEYQEAELILVVPEDATTDEILDVVEENCLDAALDWETVDTDVEEEDGTEDEIERTQPPEIMPSTTGTNDFVLERGGDGDLSVMGEE